MIRGNSNPMTHPLFPASALLPLSEQGGVMYPMEHTLGVLRPYSATLGVPMPVEGKKHDTAATTVTRQQPTQRSMDGKVINDVLPIHGTDS